MFDSLIHVHSNGFKTTLNILSPFNYNQIKLHGERKFSIKYSYQIKESICIYKSDELFCFSELRIKYDDFSIIELIEADHLDIELAGFDDPSDIPIFDLSIFQTKQIKFFYIRLDSNNLQIAVIPPSSDQNLLEFNFEGIDIEVISMDEILKFNYLTCSLENLVGWREVIINDIISVSGDFPDDNFIVTLLNTNKDYIAEVSLSYLIFSNIYFSDGSVRIGNSIFKTSCKDQMIPFQFYLDGSIVDFNCEEVTQKAPYCSLSVIGESVITFIGNWSEIDYYFKIVLSSTLTIVNTNFITCDISGNDVLDYISDSEVTGINGTILLESSDGTNIQPLHHFSTDLNPSIRTNVIFTNLIFTSVYVGRSSSPFLFRNSNIDLEITKIGTDEEEANKPSFAFDLYADEYGSSTISVIEPFSNAVFKSKINRKLNIVGKLKSDESYGILKNNFTIVRGPSYDMIVDYKLSIIPVEDVIKAFTRILTIDFVPEDVGEYTNVILYASGGPAKIEYAMQYLSDDNWPLDVGLLLSSEDVLNVFWKNLNISSTFHYLHIRQFNGRFLL